MEHYPAATAAIAALDEENQRIVLLRLAAKFNNGDEHFDHSPGGASWLCLACLRKAFFDAVSRANAQVPERKL